ncbi:MAG: CDGSH iron-sulfur domain-containing protein [Planctomycetes bacterium]|nr:CDGSH iron-sulfur domain-containing protein [Planctomycetota bacterium]MBI3843413.1 CDGSH iron-sulfur domain-containing protein [Planctomycetota bacterium]
MSPIEIVVGDNGPLRVTGSGITLKDASGKAFDLAGREAISLCRCGHSANKPFCDGSHAKSGFTSKCEARALPPPKPKT